jgi:hypothetical protein
MPFGPSRCSIAAEAARRFDRLKLGEIKFDNRPQGLGERTVLLVVRQGVQPCGIFGLQFHGRGDGVVPPLDPGASVGGAACADNRCASGVSGAVDLMSVSSPGEPGKGSKARALPWTRQGRSPWNQSVRCLRPRPELPSPDASVAAPKV